MALNFYLYCNSCQNALLVDFVDNKLANIPLEAPIKSSNSLVFTSQAFSYTLILDPILVSTSSFVLSPAFTMARYTDENLQRVIKLVLKSFF